MREYTKRLSDFEKLSTHKTINSDLMFLFGITIQDFLAALIVFLGVCLIPGFLTPFFALFAGICVILISKSFRKKFPKHYFRHLFLAYGLTKNPVMHNPFREKKSRFVSFSK